MRHRALLCLFALLWPGLAQAQDGILAPLHARVEHAATRLSDRAGPLFLLTSIARAAPAEVQVRRIEQSGQRVVIEGWSMSNALIAEFMDRLDYPSEHIDSVWLEEINSRTESEVTVKEFRLTLRLRVPGSTGPVETANLGAVLERYDLLKALVPDYTSEGFVAASR